MTVSDLSPSVVLDVPSTTQQHTPAGIDPRGPRFGAAVTTVVLSTVFLLVVNQPVLAGAVLAVQALVFALGAVIGLQAQPYGWLFRSLVRPRLAAPVSLEDPRPPRFAQAVGLGFAIAGLVALILGSTTVTLIAVGAALAAAFLNAALGFCLGCEMYLLVVRLRARISHGS
jgi:hypothetical protein